MIYTVGHSTRSFDELVALLRAHRIGQLIDIRTIPRSRRHPHFSREALEQRLPAASIGYRHQPALGGLRKPRRDSVNGAWQNESFRGYADYMQTPAFQRAVDELIASADQPDAPGTAIMCAEAVWWRCHRQLVADALVARGLTVRHILSANSAPEHRLTDFARVDGGLVTYPALV
jgi:uncharacterized protein (DUF488 family)